MKTQAGCRLSSLKTQLNAVRRSNACKVLGGTEYLEDEAMDNPLISVIIPVYNVEKYLRECVDSVLNQTYDNFEIILIDDGSTDSSGKICDEYACNDARITVVHKENGGLSSARNAGAEKASGKYIYYLDSDDYIDNETFSSLVKNAEENSSDIVFFSAFSFIDGGGEAKQNYVYKNEYKTDSGRNVFDRLIKNGEFHSAVPLLFFKNEFIKKNGLSFIDGMYHEDMIYTFEAFMSASCVSYINECFYKRRYRADSIMTSRKSEKYFNDMSRVYYTVSEYKKTNSVESEAVDKYIARCAFNALNLYKKLSAEEQKKNRERYDKLKSDILDNGAYGDDYLKARCRSTAMWAAKKAVGKIFGR